MEKTIRVYGHIRDKYDPRDIQFKITAPVTLPKLIDLRPDCPPVFDQGQLGSCTANAIAGAVMFDLMRQKMLPFIPARLFIYYNERVMENTVNEDAGAQIRDGIKSINALGVPPEKFWPYDITKFAVKPPIEAYAAALKHQAVQYASIPQNLIQLRNCLAAGFPFVFGFSVYESFESAIVAKSGVVNLPGKGEQCQGGHAVVCVGYDDKSKRFIVRNSWGPDWGQKGYFTIPYAYLSNTNLASDFWQINLLS